MTKNIKHSSASVQWYTPPEVLDCVREVLGIIDLDPASCAAANLYVGARRYFGVEDDGLTAPWGDPDAVYLNPPGGKWQNKSAAGVFWKKLMGEKFGHAIFMAFNLELLQSTQRLGCEPILEFPFCVPRKRISFVSPTGGKNRPSHSNALVYVPRRINRTADFVRVFSKLGEVIT